MSAEERSTQLQALVQGELDKKSRTTQEAINATSTSRALYAVGQRFYDTSRGAWYECVGSPTTAWTFKAANGGVSVEPVVLDFAYKNSDAAKITPTLTPETALKPDNTTGTLSGFSISGFISIDSLKFYHLFLSDTLASSFVLFAAYDENQNPLFELLGGNVSFRYKYISLNFSEAVKYVRYTVKDSAEATDGVFSSDSYTGANEILYPLITDVGLIDPTMREPNTFEPRYIDNNYNLVATTLTADKVLKANNTTGTQAGYSISDFISIDSSKFHALFLSDMLASSFVLFAAYDENQSPLFEFLGGNTSYKNKYIPLSLSGAVKYIRYTVKTVDAANCGFLISDQWVSFNDLIYEANRGVPVVYDFAIQDDEASKISTTLTADKALKPNNTTGTQAGYSISGFIPITSGLFYSFFLSDTLATSFVIFSAYDENQKQLYELLGGNTSFRAKQISLKFSKIVKYIRYTVKTSKTATDGLFSTNVCLSANEILGHTIKKRKKSMVVFGTSIPAQGSIVDSYFSLIAKSLGMTCYNEAVGGSMVRAFSNNTTTGNAGKFKGLFSGSLLKSLSQTIAEKQHLMSYWQTGLDENGDVGGVGTYGYRDFQQDYFADYTTIAPYSEVLGWSYENKIIAKYLDSTNPAFIEMPDFFVFDHGYNDLSQDVYDSDESSAIAKTDSKDRKTFISAMNFVINEILTRNPRARILLVGHYAKDRKPRVYQAQENLFDSFDFAAIKLWNKLGFTQKEVLTTGYWSGGEWINSGGAPQTMTMTEIYMEDDLHPATLETRVLIANALMPFIRDNF